MEYEMDGDTVTFREPKFRHFAFLAPLAAAAAPAALEWITGKVKGLFSGAPKEEEASGGEEEGEEEDADVMCDIAGFNSLDVEYDEEEGSISLHVPQIANMTERDQDAFATHMAADFMGMFSNLLSKGTDLASGYLGLRKAQQEGKIPVVNMPNAMNQGPAVAASARPAANGGDDGSVSEEEEEEDASVLLPPGERFALRRFKLGRRHRHKHRHSQPPASSSLGGDIRDAANGR